jgi:uncharacterized protein (TIGR02145 family)
MHKLLLTTVAVAAAIAGAGCGAGTLTDNRDGQTYKTVTIGNQTWMAQNLNYKTDSSWCYNDSLSYCKKYGRLYNWNAAKKACPAGWKLPDTADWNRLVTTVGGEKTAGRKLKSKSGWKKHADYTGTDDFGFSALPDGDCDIGNSFGHVGIDGNWWSATESTVVVDAYYRGIVKDYFNLSAYHRGMHYDFDALNVGRSQKRSAFSVRCVADTP